MLGQLMAVQTAGIIVIAGVLVYVVVQLKMVLTEVASQLTGALTIQRALQEKINRIEQEVLRFHTSNEEGD